MVQNGIGIEQDIELALNLYQKSCQLGNETGCNMLNSLTKAIEEFKKQNRSQTNNFETKEESYPRIVR